MLKKWLFRFVAPSLSMISLTIMPFQANARPLSCDEGCLAENTIDTCEQPCESTCGSKDWMQKLGWLAVAAGVGALTAWGVAESIKGGHRGKSGCPGAEGPTGNLGPTGSTGPSPVEVTEDTVTFFFDGTVNVTDINAGSSIIIFIETPVGEVVALDAIPVTSTGLIALTSGPISVYNAPMGTYNIGVTIAPSITIDAPSELVTEISTTRTSTLTIDNLIITSTPLLIDNEMQFTSQFTYGTTNGTVFP